MINVYILVGFGFDVVERREKWDSQVSRVLAVLGPMSSRNVLAAALQLSSPFLGLARAGPAPLSRHTGLSPRAGNAYRVICWRISSLQIIKMNYLSVRVNVVMIVP